MRHVSEFNRQHSQRNKGRKYSQFPLRHITQVTRFAEGMFDKDSVLFECGHEGTATSNAKRGRCKKCANGERSESQ